MCLNVHAVASHIGSNVYFINNKRTLPCLKSSGKGYHVQTISPSAGAAMLRIRDGREREILCRQVKFSVFCSVAPRERVTCKTAKHLRVLQHVLLGCRKERVAREGLAV
jgi:hypothetical protein